MSKWKKSQILEAHSQRNWMQKALMAPVYNFSVYGEIFSMTVLSSMVMCIFLNNFKKELIAKRKDNPFVNSVLKKITVLNIESKCKLPKLFCTQEHYRICFHVFLHK